MTRLPQLQAEFDSLANDVVEESIQAFTELAGLAPSDDNATQYLRIVSAMFGMLSASKIPRGRITKDFPVEDLDIAFASLVGLGVTLPIWLNYREELAKELSDHWPDIRRWLLFLYRTVVGQLDLDTATRYTCKSAIVEFLGLLRDRLLLSWSKTITTDREIMRMICDLWFIETRDSRFSSWSPKGNTQRESAIFNACFLVAHEMGTTIDWGNLLSLFHGEPDAIATVAMCHLDHETSRQKEWDIHCIAWDLHIITVFSFRENIRVALLGQGAIKAASDVLEFIVDSQWEGEAQVLAGRCMVNALVVLRSCIEDMDALPFLTQAIKHGLISSLLKCEFLIQFSEHPSAHQLPVVLMGVILPGYTVYRSILYLLVIAIDSVVATKLEDRLAKGGELHKAWEKLKAIVNERCGLARRDIANGHIQTCQNDVCGKTTRLDKFKRCSGCLHAYYCSRQCQRYDWRNGKHKPYCTRVHQRFIRTNGSMSTVHRKDLKFLDQVILAELRKHRARLGAHPSKLTLVELNLVGGQVNADFDPRGTNANPFGTKCECETFANARWKRMAEVVREGKRQIVLVRTFISGGASRKIVLQAIPLSMVMNGEQVGRYKDQVGERYQFNLMFTCCGSEGGP